MKLLEIANTDGKVVRETVSQIIKSSIRGSKARWQFDKFGLDLGLQYLGDDLQEAKKVIDDIVSRLLKKFQGVKISKRTLPGGIKQKVFEISPGIEFFHLENPGTNSRVSDFGFLVKKIKR